MPVEYFPLTGRLLLTDEGARVVFDTDEEMLCMHLDDFKTGSQVVPARTASSEGVDGDQIMVDVSTDYYLADVALPGAFVVRGMMRSTATSSPENLDVDNLWRQASGTHLDILDGVSTTQVPQSDLGGYNRVATMGGYTLYVNALGHLVLNERIVMRCRDSGGPPTKYNRARRQTTIEFRILIGFFHGADFGANPGIVFADTWGRYDNAHSQSTSFGHAFDGRECIVIVSSDRNPSQSPSVSIGGSAATIDLNYTGWAGNITIARRQVDAGDSLSVSVSYGSIRSFFVTAFVGRHLGAASSFSAATASGTTLSTSIAAGAGKAGLLLAPISISPSVDPFTRPDPLTVADGWTPVGPVSLYNYFGTTWLRGGVVPNGSVATGVTLGADTAARLALAGVMYG